jgi:glutathione S-transferase
MPLGKVPVLEIGGKEMIPQSLAIGRFFAKKTKTYGSNDLEALRIDALMESAADVLAIIGRTMRPALSSKNDDLKVFRIRVAGNHNSLLLEGRMGQSARRSGQALAVVRKNAEDQWNRMVGWEFGNFAHVVIYRYTSDALNFYQVSVADFFIGEYAQRIEEFIDSTILKDLPQLKKLTKAIANLPKVKEYIATRPKTSF